MSLDDFENLIVFDTDAGLDDAWALLFLLKAEELKRTKVLGITCVNGNTKIQNVIRNVFRVLDTVDRADIPVFRGASTPLLKFTQSDLFHGEDGFADVYEHGNDDELFKRLQSKDAITAMYEFACKHPKKVKFVLVGPLTNFALCLRTYDDFADKVKGVYIMGGNRKGVGNTTACAEFNFYIDPEAAYIALNEPNFPKTILPWEACLQKYVIETTLEWRFTTLSSVNNKITKLMDEPEKKVFTKYGRWNSCDAFLAAALIFPDKVIKRQCSRHVSVELNGAQTRGQMIVDHTNKQQENATIIEAVDFSYIKTLALWVANHDVQI